MIARSIAELRMRWLATLVTSVLAFPLLLVQATASQIEISWTRNFDQKSVSIEAGGTQLYTAALQGNALIVETDPMIVGDGKIVSATVAIEGGNDFAIGVNLFKCTSTCRWRLSLIDKAVETNSRAVSRICQSSPRTLDGQFEKYFYCRRAHASLTQANDQCWPEALNSLSGWFDAAYKLKEVTSLNGVSFIARDNEVVERVKTTQSACPHFEQTVRRKAGYFEGMIRNLDLSVLQQAQLVESALNAGNATAARDFAASLAVKLDKIAPVRQSISFKDAAYVEGVVRRSLGAESSFSIR